MVKLQGWDISCHFPSFIECPDGTFGARGRPDGATQTLIFAIRRENSMLLILIAGLDGINYHSTNAGKGIGNTT